VVQAGVVFCANTRSTQIPFPEAEPFLETAFEILRRLWRFFQILWIACACSSAMPACLLHPFTQLSRWHQEVVRRLEIELMEKESSVAVVKAKTTKLSNLRFNIKGALTKEVPELALETVSVLHDSIGPLGPALLTLRLLRAAFDLSIVQLSSTDGRVLVELFKFAKEEHMIKTDEFFAYMKGKMDIKELYGSLNKLEKLNCIERSDFEINLIETIIFK
jgi:hypothetical protein